VVDISNLSLRHNDAYHHSYITAAATTTGGSGVGGGGSGGADPNESYMKIAATSGRAGVGAGGAHFVRALYPSAATSEAELVFKEGDIIQMLEPSDEFGWCKGSLDGTEGIYPANYCEDVPPGTTVPSSVC
jgi:hypothetical protein